MVLCNYTSFIRVTFFLILNFLNFVLSILCTICNRVAANSSVEQFPVLPISDPFRIGSPDFGHFYQDKRSKFE